MRLLILSDIHSNIAALRAVAGHAGLFDAVAFAGDAVDYGPRPAECIAWLRTHARWAVRGNHDDALANDGNCRSSLAYRELAIATRQLNRAALGQADRDYLGKLPLSLTFQFGRRRFGLVHATPAQPLYRYLPEVQTDDELRSALQPLLSEVDVLIVGHTHRPFIRQLDDKWVVNPGSVGQPRYTAPNASYALWEDGQLSLQRTAYALGETDWQLETMGLTPQAAKKLSQVLHTGSLS